MQEEENLLIMSFGCFHHVKSLEEKYHIAEDLKRWFVLEEQGQLLKGNTEFVFP
jgi:hypothetical protein